MWILLAYEWENSMWPGPVLETATVSYMPEWHHPPCLTNPLKGLPYGGSAEPKITQFTIHWPLKKASHAPWRAANKSRPEPDSLLTLVSGYTPGIKREEMWSSKPVPPHFCLSSAKALPPLQLHLRLWGQKHKWGPGRHFQVPYYI